MTIFKTVKLMLVAAVIVSNLTLGLPASAQQEAPAVQMHIDRAIELAGPRYQTAITRLCQPRNARPQGDFPEAVAPAKIFDNLYFLGLPNVYSWALDTPEGIILLDALNNDEDAEVTIVGGMEKLGLDPSRIEYVLISHEHADHFGGVRYLQERFGARVLATEEAWRAMEENPGRATPPRRDMVVSDGDTVTLGGTTITMYATPGHTPGSISTLVPVIDGGQRHLAFFLNGPRTVSLETSREMLASTQRIAQLARTAGVDVELNNHSFIDNSLPTIEEARTRRTGQPNPFVIGVEGFQNFVGGQIECLSADVARGEY